MNARNVSATTILAASRSRRSLAGRQGPAIVAVLMILVVPGCLPVSVFQSPEVLDAGAYALGGGISAVRIPDVPQVSGYVMLRPEVSGRLGLGHRFDVGAKVPLAWEGLGLYADLRRQLAVAPFPITASAGASVAAGELPRVAGYPGIAAGGDRFWMGARGIFFKRDLESAFEWGGAAMAVGTRAATGGMSLLPELNVYYIVDDGSSEVMVGLGLGVQFTRGAPDP